jgi:hypothetical protein
MYMLGLEDYVVLLVPATGALRVQRLGGQAEMFPLATPLEASVFTTVKMTLATDECAAFPSCH